MGLATVWALGSEDRPGSRAPRLVGLHRGPRSAARFTCAKSTRDPSPRPTFGARPGTGGEHEALFLSWGSPLSPSSVHLSTVARRPRPATPGRRPKSPPLGPGLPHHRFTFRPRGCSTSTGFSGFAGTRHLAAWCRTWGSLRSTAARCSLRRFPPRRQPCRITAASALLPFPPHRCRSTDGTVLRSLAALREQRASRAPCRAWRVAPARAFPPATTMGSAPASSTTKPMWTARSRPARRVAPTRAS